ncbi:MAG: hypothetical protein JKY95_00640 [Planctomycetaceae bacterium]|nr:hypothetical protein [Planctomycetaceae bacterium]
MDSLQYKTLVSYLPGMASVVNSFNSEQVQIAVFDRLITALEKKSETVAVASGGRSSGEAKADTVPEASSGELEHDLVEGESIHAIIDADN